MARFNYEEAENYGGNGGTGFFSLKDDGDVANVRIMYNSIDDLEAFSCHEITVDDKRHWVNCLRNYNDPISACPFCNAQKFTTVKVFMPIYDENSGQVKVWERGKKFIGKISSLCSRYPNLVSHTFDIERRGKKGDTATTYEIYETGKDDTTLEDLPEPSPVLGKLVYDKSAEEMEYYLDNGVFPAEGVQRRESSTRRRNEEVPFEAEEPARRRPTRRGDNF